jgi:hypothetical protein
METEALRSVAEEPLAALAGGALDASTAKTISASALTLEPPTLHLRRAKEVGRSSFVPRPRDYGATGDLACR